MPMIVAPAGNEGIYFDPYFPGRARHAYSANHASYVAQANPVDFFENVIGVGSLGPKPSTPFAYNSTPLTDYHFGASSFSNTGYWVTCSAIGENVHSAFVPLHPMWREDDQTNPRPRIGFRYPAAFWNGTSFAAPKVSAAIAARAAALPAPRRSRPGVRSRT